MIRTYDRGMRGYYSTKYYEGSGFYNFGHWEEHTTSQREASEALIDRLVDRIPKKEGRILDVACGLGASTKRLMRNFPADMITAINISAAQIAEAARIAPGCTFRQMNATQLEFPDNHFSAVICVEAAFHFDTRRSFLREALRVLKPGGRLVLSDVLFRKIITPIARLTQVPRANLVPNIASYREQIAATGFDEVEIEDATRPVLDSFRRHLVGWPKSERRAGRMRFKESVAASLVCRMIAGYFGIVCKGYILASAQKP